MTEPKSFEEAYSDPKWINAINNEISALEKLKTFSIVPKPHNIKEIHGKWVFKYKEAENLYKARLVAKGFTQKYGKDYLETIRLFLIFALNHNLLIKQFDVKTAFLNGTISETLYIR